MIKKNTIIVKLQGGLGNQLFQYALGRSLADRAGATLKLDISEYQKAREGNTPRAYALGNFNIAESFASPMNILPFRIGIKKTLKERHSDFNPALLETRESIYLDGYWHSENYFKDIGEIIRKEFTLKNPLEPQYQKIANAIVALNTLNEPGKINGPQAVAVHIRRGDFVTDKKTSAVHLVCDLEYYQRGIAYLSGKIANPYFFVFSDDIKWVEKNLKFSHPITYVSPESGAKDYPELAVMSLCKHFIISNSSFSWWSAWLSDNPAKIVYSPERWTNKTKMLEIEGLVPKSWLPFNEGNMR